MLLEINLGVVCQLSGLLSSPGPGGYNIVLYYDRVRQRVETAIWENSGGGHDQYRRVANTGGR